MNKYKVTWYIGNILKVETEIKSFEVEAEDISKVDYMSILPAEIRKNSYYQRTIFSEEDVRNIDYGSYFRFIEIRKIK